MDPELATGLDERKTFVTNWPKRGAKRALLGSFLGILMLVLGADLSANIRTFLGYVSSCAHQKMNSTLFGE